MQACDDELDKLDTEHRRDSFCGKISVCNNFRQYGIPWTDTATHTVALDSPAFFKDLEFFASVCRVANGLRQRPHRRHWRPPRRLSNHALQRKATAGLRHHRDPGGPLGNPGGRQPG